MKVSIITACRNSQEFIYSAINSVNNQTYDDIEHVFIDGKSSDRTLDIIKGSSIRDNIIISEPDDGIYHALNKGIELATGDIIGFVHSDDFLFNDNVIQNVVSAFRESDADIIYGDLNYVLKSDSNFIFRKWISGPFSPSNFELGWMPPHPTFFMKSDSYKKLGSFNTVYNISADYDAMIRYMWLTPQNVFYIPSVLTCMRVGGESNRNLNRIINKTREDVIIMSFYGFPVFKTIFLKNFLKLSQFTFFSYFYKKLINIKLW